jgi:hypothetical protein
MARAASCRRQLAWVDYGSSGSYFWWYQINVGICNDPSKKGIHISKAGRATVRAGAGRGHGRHLRRSSEEVAVSSGELLRERDGRAEDVWERE